jgi:p-cumic alcohol dehydrogenase
MDVRDKVVVVTGAARGIGQEFARSLATVGARIVAADINSCSATLELVEAQGAKALGVTLDVRDANSAVDMVAAVTQAFGRVDALINNAALYGALRGGRFDAIAEADWDAAMAVNVKGIWNCCKAAVPAMRRAGGGSIIKSRIPSCDLRYALRAALHHLKSGRYRSNARPRS